jgi:hypothetical protein
LKEGTYLTVEASGNCASYSFTGRGVMLFHLAIDDVSEAVDPVVDPI